MSEGYEIFEGWVDKLKADIDSGAEIKIVVKSLDTFTKMNVLAKIGKSEEDLPEGEHLRVVNDMGERKDEMFIKIIEELGDDEPVGAVET